MNDQYADGADQMGGVKARYRKFSKKAGSEVRARRIGKNVPN